MLATLNDNSAAKEQLEKAIALGFREPQVHFVLGKAYRVLGNDAGAQQQFQQHQQGEQAELNKEMASAKYNQAGQAKAAGNYPQAAVYYRKRSGRTHGTVASLRTGDGARQDRGCGR